MDDLRPGFHKIAATRRKLLSEIRLNVWSCYIWIAWVYLAVLLLAVLIAIAPAQVLGGSAILSRTQNLANLVNLASSVGFAVAFARYLLVRRNPRTRLKDLVPAGASFAREVHGALQKTGEFTGISPETIAIYLCPGGHSLQAFTLAVSGRNCLCLSPGMAKLLRQQPEDAVGILIHEFAHIEQKDVSAVAISYRFVKYQAILTILLMPSLSFSYSQIEGSLALYAFLFALSVLALAAANRSLRRSSERAADLLAVLCGAGDNLQQVLRHSLVNSPRPSIIRKMMSNHPLLDQRIRWLGEAQASLSRDSVVLENIAAEKKSLQLTFPDFFKTGIRIFLRALLYVIVIVALLIFYVWIRT